MSEVGNTSPIEAQLYSNSITQVSVELGLVAGDMCKCGSISEFLGFLVLGRVATSDLASTCCPGGKDDAGEISRRVPCVRCANRSIHSQDITS